MTTTETLIRAYMDASAELLEAALAGAEATNPTGAAALRKALAAGAVMSLHSTFAPAAGLARMNIEFVEPTGRTLSLLSCDLEQEATGG